MTSCRVLRETPSCTEFHVILLKYRGKFIIFMSVNRARNSGQWYHLKSLGRATWTNILAATGWKWTEATLEPTSFKNSLKTENLPRTLWSGLERCLQSRLSVTQTIRKYDNQSDDDSRVMITNLMFWWPKEDFWNTWIWMLEMCFHHFAATLYFYF